VKKPEDLFEIVREALPGTPAMGLSTVILAKLSQMEADDAVNELRDESGKCAKQEYYNSIKMAILGDSDYAIYRPNIFKI